jgi:small subunit ribosomal protein S6
MNYDSEGTSAVSARVEAVLKNAGAEVKNTQSWGKRKLAYPIDKERYGDYILLHFEGENPDLAEFHRELEIESGVLHYMTIRLDEFPDFNALTVPQTIDADRKRPAAPGGRRPRYEDVAEVRDDEVLDPTEDEAPKEEVVNDSTEASDEVSDDEPEAPAEEEVIDETPAEEADMDVEEATEEATEEDASDDSEASEETAEEEKPADAE